MSLFDLYQQHAIRQNGKRMQMNEVHNDHQHRRSRDEIELLHARIDRLVLVNEALWQLMAHHTGLTEDDLASMVDELDMSDGVRDGRRQATATECSCGAKINPKAKVCQFCGEPPSGRSPFEAV